MVEARLFDKKSAPELLEEFRATGAQAPFEEVVRRYAGMVYSVCLRVTRNSHDAEDATQAVFLALASQGKTAKPIRYIGPWLQQVAHRLSLDIRRSKKRQKSREEKVGEMMRSTNGNGHANGNGSGHGGGHVKDCPARAYEQDELKRVINDEINQLPSKYRLPLILHYFGGLTREQMAEELGVRSNTLGVRVYRGRELLGKRLAARGMTLGAGALTLMLTDCVGLRVNESLIVSTCHAVAAATGGIGGGPGVGASVFAAQVAGITQSIARGMLLSKIKFVATIVVAVGSAAAGGAKVISRIPPLDMRFSLPLDIGTRLGDMFRSFVRPIQFTGAIDDEGATLDLLDVHRDDDATFSSRAWRYTDPLADRYIARGLEMTRPTPPAIPARGEGGTIVASAQAALSASEHARAAAQVLAEVESSAGHSVAGAASSNVASPTAGSGLPRVYSLAAAPTTLRKPPERSRSMTVAAPLHDVVLNGARGLPDARLVEAGESNRWRSLTVGGFGHASFKQTGGSSRIDNDLTIARSEGSTGKVELSGGTISTGGNQYVGLAGHGEFVQSGGVNVVAGSLFVGYEGSGAYALTGGSLTGDAITVAFTGEGHFTQGLDAAEQPLALTAARAPSATAASDVHFNVVTVADKQGSHGTIELYSGNFTSAMQTIGRAGDGSVRQDGGTNNATTILLGTTYQSIGSYVLSGGTLRLNPNAETIDGDAGITIGGAGSGSFRLGNANRAARIVESEAGTNLAVRAKESGTGLFRGWGSVGLTGLVVNNGRIVADGYGHDRELNLSTAAGVTNTIENPIIAGANGWYARHGGTLVLPAIDILPGSHAYSWGEDPLDALPDLVNSVRLYVRDAKSAGEVSISLLSLDRTDIPTLPSGHNFIGIWSFDAADLAFTGVDLAVRYDDALAQEKGLSESVLKLWKYENDAWVRINDDSFRRYAALNILSGYAGPDLTYFAVSAPEPTALGGLLLGGWMLMRRRRS